MANMTSPLLMGEVAISPSRLVAVGPTLTFDAFVTCASFHVFSRFALRVSSDTVLLAVSYKADAVVFVVSITARRVTGVTKLATLNGALNTATIQAISNLMLQI